VARTGTEAGTGTEGETRVEGCRKDNLVVVEEKVVLVIEEVLVKIGEGGDERKEEDVEDGTGGENMGHFFTRPGDKYWAVHCSSSSSSSDSSSDITPPVAGAQALARALAYSLVSFPPP